MIKRTETRQGTFPEDFPNVQGPFSLGTSQTRLRIRRPLLRLVLIWKIYPRKRHMLSRAFYIGIRLGRTVSLSNNPEIDRPNSWNLDLPGTEGRRKGEMEPSQL